jgi:hypothetical protein
LIRLLAFLLLTPLLMAPSCGLDSDKERGEPCTADSECDEEAGLTCRGGICDAQAGDAGTDAS